MDWLARNTVTVTGKQCVVSPSLFHSQHPDDLGLVSFLIDTWVVLAILSGPAEAAKLLESQPPDVQLMFEVVSDAFKAHAEKDHLHRLAPERRAPVMELLKRLMT